MEPSDVECGCKVGQSLSQYGLGDVHEEVRRKRDDGESLRSLADHVNERLLEAAIEQARRDVIADADTAYRKLVGDDVGAGERAEFETRMERAGIDVESLRSDFVSHQTVRDHLNDCLGMDTSRERDVSVESAERTINWARSRQLAVVGETLDRLAGTETFALGEYDLTQTTRVTCQDCGRTATIDELLGSGGCDCDDR